VRSNPQLWWFVARSSGIVAWALCTLSVVLGLALSSRILGRKPTGPWLLDLHRHLGGLAVVFVGVHLAGLVADSYVHFGPSELFVPMASAWKPGPVAWGIVAFYLLVAVEVTSLLKRRLPKGLWHAVHLSSYPLYATATVHVVTAGTDAPGALTWAAVGSVALVVFLTMFRVSADRLSSAGRRGSRTPTRGVPGSVA
jgi:DMSO/TMAO reductase YedYZ heme-binding membrane subunit